MKSKLKTGKRLLSVFMAVLMVMTAWVFVAPEKAEAATAGTYNVVIKHYAINGFDNDSTNCYCYGKNNNGTGSQTLFHTEPYGSNSDWFETNTVGSGGKYEYKGNIYSGTTSYFPTYISFYVKKSRYGWTDGEWGIEVWVNGEKIGAATQKVSGKGSATLTWSCPSAKLPKINKITWTGNDLTIKTTPDGKNASATATNSATVYDQYGVEWYQEPNWVVHTKTTSQTSSDTIQGVAGSSGQDKGIVYANKTAFTVDNGVNGDGLPKTVYYNPTLGGVTGDSKKVTIYNTASMTYYWYENTSTNGAYVTKSGKQEFVYGATPSNSLSTIRDTYGIAVVDNYYTSINHYKNGTFPTLGAVTDAATTTITYSATNTAAHSLIYTSISDTQHKYHCSSCGYIKTAAENHAWPSTGTVVTQATCLAMGTTQYACSKCGKTKQETDIGKKDHNYNSTTNFGNMTLRDGKYYHTPCCTNGCNQPQPITDPDVKWIACTFGDPVVTKAATCLASGTKKYTCTACGGSYEEVIPPLGHSFGEYVEDTGTDLSATRHGPWCETNGTKTRTCALCGTTETVEADNALEHDWQHTWTQERTCYQVGISNDKCARCGQDWASREYPKLPHTYTTDYEVYIQPTCTQVGKQHRFCDVAACRYEDVQDVNPLNHSWEKDENGNYVYTVDWEPTCEVDGQKSVHCTRGDCDGINALYNITPIAALTHDYKYIETVEPTCTEIGYKLYECQREGCTDQNATAHYKREKTKDALGHDPTNMVHIEGTETCTKPGRMKAKCQRCGIDYEGVEYRESEYILGHNFETWTAYEEADENTKPDETAAEHGPWCDFDGTESSICTRCNNEDPNEPGGRKVRTKVGSALGHNIVSGVYQDDATCSKDGTKRGDCVRCGGQGTVAIAKGTALGHEMTDWAIHENDEVYGTSNPTCTEDGLEERHCTRGNCDGGTDKNGIKAKETRVVPALGHTPGEGKIEYREGQAARTCEKNGKHSLVVYCTVCHKELAAESDYNVLEPMSGHNYGAAEYEYDVFPTCQEYGSYYLCYYCQNDYCDVTQDYNYKDENGQTQTKNRHFKKITEDSDKIIMEKVSCVPGDWIVTKKANCYHDGTKIKQCIWCESKLVDYTIPQREHTKIQTHEPATCEKRSRDKIVCTAEVSPDYLYYDLREYDYEPDCDYDESILDSFGETVPHQKDEGKIDESTRIDQACERPGSYDMVYRCIYCERELERETIFSDALAHVPGDPEEEILKNPTCTSEGSKAVKYTCTICHTALSRDEVPIPATNHVADNAHSTQKVVAPTCTKDGTITTIVKCMTCDKEFSRETQVIQALGHDEKAPVKENEIGSTCGEAGSYDKVIYCSRCLQEVSRETIMLDLLDHESSDEWTVTVEPTCFKEGTQILKCKNCEYIFETKSVSMKPHTLNEGVVTEPTCITKGFTTYTCTAEGCTYTKIDNETDMIPHDFKDVVTPPTCLTEGYTTSMCQYCRYSEVKDITAKTEHQFGQFKKTSEGTCTKPSTFSRTCPLCGTVETKEGEYGSCVIVTVKGTPATCDNSGLSDGKICSECGKVPEGGEQKVIPALGHKDDNLDHKCDNCGGDYDVSGDCNCICHKTFFLMRIIYAIERVFWKLFKISKTCYCGVDHY